MMVALWHRFIFETCQIARFQHVECVTVNPETQGCLAMSDALQKSVIPATLAYDLCPVCVLIQIISAGHNLFSMACSD